MEHSLLFNALIYLAAAVVAVPIAKRLGLGAVLGYFVTTFSWRLWIARKWRRRSELRAEKVTPDKVTGATN